MTSSGLNTTSPSLNDTSMLADDVGTTTEPEVSFFPEQVVTDILWKFCPPVLLFLGTFGNLATIIVYQRMKTGDSSQPLFLTALAVADLFVLYSGIVPDIAYNIIGFDLRGMNNVACKLINFINYSSSMMTSWFLVAVTLQRAMSITWPHRVIFLCSRRKSGFTIVAIALASMAYQSHVPYGMIVHEDVAYLDGRCAGTEEYELFWRDLWSWIDINVYSVIPTILLLISNCILIRSLRVSAKQVSSMGAADTAGDRKKIASSMTITLIMISVAFLVLVTPIQVAMILWYLWADRVDGDPELAAVMDLVWVVTSMLWYANSVVNFLLYCFSGSRFRQEFLKCFGFGRDKARQETTTTSTVPLSTAS